MEGYFKVHRKILDSQVFAHQIALKIWIWCLAKVTFKERFVSLKSGKGFITVKLMPGQFIFGRFKAEEELNIDGSTIYKWMQKFASDEFDMIKIESNNQYSIITICKWEEYQNGESDEVTSKEQPSNNQVTAKEQPSNTNNNDNKEKNEKKANKSPDFIDKILDCFVQEHGSYEIINKGKERQAITKLLGIYKNKYPNANTEETIEGMRKYFKLCINIPDVWLMNNMSPSLIVSKFNEINKILKNGTNRKNSGATEEQIARIIAENFGSDSGK